MSSLVIPSAFATEDVRRTVFDNGLVVLTKEVHTSPIVTSMIWYKVGSRNEELGHTGKSHFLEHMLFKGTDHFKKGEIDLITLKNGGGNNAFTSHDFTAYYFSFASDRWEIALEIEADRMVNCSFEPDEFEAEKKVVIEELKTGLDSPWGLLLQEVEAAAFKVHPYRNPIVGWLQDVERATVEQQETYYRRYYHPNNAILVIAGDFDTDKVLTEVAHFFGPIPAGPSPGNMLLREPAQRGERRLVVRWRSKVPRLAITYHAPETAHRDSYALQVLAVVLGEGKASRFYQRLVEREQTVTFVSAEYGEAKDPTLFHIRSEARGNHSIDDIEASIYDELAQIISHGVTARELDRAKHQIEAHFILSRERTLDQAILLGQLETLCGIAYIDTYLKQIAAVTSEEVADVCKRYLNEDNRTVGVVLSAMDQIQTGRTKVKPTELGLRRVFDVHKQILKNGLKVLLVENPSIPTVSLNASVLTGARYDPESKAGLAIMVSRLLDEGTENRTSLEIAEAIESVGGAIDADGSFERIVVSAGVLRKDIDLGMELLADLLIRPIFPPEYVDKEKERTLSEITSAKDRPQVVAGWAFNELIYQDHPLHRPSHGYPETVERMTREDLRDFHKQYFVPNNTIMSIVGDFRVSELLPKIEKIFGGWPPGPIDFPTYPKPVRQTEKRHKFINMPAQQLNIYLGHLGVTRTNPDYYVLQVLDTILGGGAGFTARIPQRLRDELGLAYTTFASITMTAGLDPGRFVSFIGTSPQNMKLATEGLINEIRRIVDEPVTAEELQDAKDYLTGSFVFAFESSPQIARFLVHAEIYGLGFDYVEKYPEYITKITIEDVARVAKQYLDSENYTLVVVGPVVEDGNVLNGNN